MIFPSFDKLAELAKLTTSQWGKKVNLVHLLINQNLSRKISSKAYMVNVIWK